MADDLPYYETMYGIKLDDWTWSYGGYFVDTHYMLTKEYISEGCFTQDYTGISVGTHTVEFLYPHWIKKQYYVEGVIEGYITLSIVSGTSGTVVDYTVRLMKVDDLGITTEIGTTGQITPINQVLNYDSTYDVGDEIVYPFFITVSPEKKVQDRERLYVEVTVTVEDGNLVLYHSNDATWEDLKINIPFRGL